MSRALLFAAAIGVLVAAGFGGASAVNARPLAGSVELTQVLGKGDTLQVVLSDTGASATETRLKSRTGVSVDYEAGVVSYLDFNTKTYRSEKVAAAVAALKSERQLIEKLQIEVPGRDGSHNPHLRFPTLTPLDLTAKIADQPAHAYLLHEQGNKTVARLWLADELPAPPAEIQEALTGAISLPVTGNHALLRDELQVGKKWVTGLDTIASREVETAPGKFAPPAGWQRAPTPKVRKPASVPARPIRLIGPVSSLPDLFVLYWNGPYAAAFTTSMNTLLTSAIGGGAATSPYWTPLGQYGVGRGRFLGSSPIAFFMPAAVGTWDFFTVQAMVTTSYFTTAAPKIWWRAFSRDPLIAIMAPSAALASGGWSGYHLVDLSLGAFLPWPVSLAAHPEMPWFIAKTSSPAAAPNTSTTTSVSHELVETVADPLPLSANTDFTKSPPWAGGELADICSVTPPIPTPTVFRFGATLAAYWSNAAGVCTG